MAFRHRLLQPRFIAVAICWLLATLYVVVRKTGMDRMASSIGESGDVRRDSRASRRTSRLDARAIAAMGRAGNEKCAWCKIVKAAGVHDSSREIVESAQSDYDPGERERERERERENVKKERKKKQCTIYFIWPYATA